METSHRSLSSKSSRTWSALPLVIAIAGCATTTMREGPVRPATELATVASTDTRVAEIDGKDVQRISPDANAKSVYLLPAGPHVIGFSLRKRLGVSITVLQSDFIRVCLLAEGGHHYTTTAEIGNGRWKPHIFEVPITCDGARIFPAGTPSSDRPLDAQAASPFTSPPSDPEAESTGLEIFHLWSNAEIERVKARPFVDVMASLGWDFGGEDVVRAQFSNGSSQTLAAGQGPFLRLGAMVTPLWLAADGVGIGAGTDVALKLDNVSASNSDVSLIRYPCSFTLHTLVRVRPILYVLLAAGVDKDEGISVSRNGGVSVTGGSSLTSRIGGTGRVALYWVGTDASAIMLGLAYTQLTYDSPGGSVRANSAGFFTSVSWRP
jgi:hypothetical protein